MAVRFARIAITCWLVAASASMASANPFRWIWNAPKKVASDIARDTKRRNVWPEPFVQPDREAARAPFATMIGHGWRQQNLIAHYHFRKDGQGLTEAGRHKVRSILFGVTPQHRIIYVQRADDAQVTASRVSDVHALAAQLSPHGELPPVVETDIAPHGRPAEWVDAVGRKFHESMPAPTLPEGQSESAF